MQESFTRSPIFFIGKSALRFAQLPVLYVPSCALELTLAALAVAVEALAVEADAETARVTVLRRRTVLSVTRLSPQMNLALPHFIAEKPST